MKDLRMAAEKAVGWVVKWVDVTVDRKVVLTAASRDG